MKKRSYLLAAFSLAFVPPCFANAQTQEPVPAAQKNSGQSSIEDSAKRLEVPILLTDGVKSVQRTREELGFALVSTTPVQFTIDKGRLKDALSAIAPTFHAEAMDARPVLTKGAFAIQPGQSARALNIPTTAEKIVQAVTANPASVRFNVSLDKHPPVVTPERLKGISGRLSQFSTVAVGTEARDTNIAIAVDRINGTLLSPGETFSLNTTVGKRTKESGFKEAHVFVDAKVVNGIGGGVSQVTGTLFNAAALAGLKIVEVNPHSRPVAYLPLGRDATVAYGDKDLRFTNNTKAPVYIVYTFQRSRLNATLWGAPTAGQKITLRPRVQRLGPGKINAQLYRLTKRSGKVIAKEKLLFHAYRWKPGED